jgi:hypothetical protein
MRSAWARMVACSALNAVTFAKGPTPWDTNGKLNAKELVLAQAPKPRNRAGRKWQQPGKCPKHTHPVTNASWNLIVWQFSVSVSAFSFRFTEFRVTMNVSKLL